MVPILELILLLFFALAHSIFTHAPCQNLQKKSSGSLTATWGASLAHSRPVWALHYYTYSGDRPSSTGSTSSECLSGLKQARSCTTSSHNYTTSSTSCTASTSLSSRSTRSHCNHGEISSNFSFAGLPLRNFHWGPHLRNFAWRGLRCFSSFTIFGESASLPPYYYRHPSYIAYLGESAHRPTFDSHYSHLVVEPFTVVSQSTGTYFGTAPETPRRSAIVFDQSPHLLTAVGTDRWHSCAPEYNLALDLTLAPTDTMATTAKTTGRSASHAPTATPRPSEESIAPSTGSTTSPAKPPAPPGPPPESNRSRSRERKENSSRAVRAIHVAEGDTSNDEAGDNPEAQLEKMLKDNRTSLLQELSAAVDAKLANSETAFKTFVAATSATQNKKLDAHERDIAALRGEQTEMRESNKEMWKHIDKLQLLLASAEEATNIAKEAPKPIRQLDEWDQTVLKVNTKEDVPFKALEEKITAMAADFGFTRDDWSLRGGQFANRFTLQFNGTTFITQRRRAEKFNNSLRSSDGTWEQTYLDAPTGANGSHRQVRVFISHDEPRYKAILRTAYPNFFASVSENAPELELTGYKNKLKITDATWSPICTLEFDWQQELPVIKWHETIPESIDKTGAEDSFRRLQREAQKNWHRG